MMSASTVSAGAAASGYYQAEGYYQAGTPEAEAAAQWVGRAAAEFDKVGQVNDADFDRLLDGETLERNNVGQVEFGRKMGKIVDGERVHRPGLDLTFSAPKAVSIAALVFGDERVTKAHEDAVKTSIGFIERSLVQTRLYDDGELKVETGGKLIGGMFRHDTSRSLDPQLHSHVVLANMVLNSKDRFTAIHNTKIFENSKLVSEIYRNELAISLGELGYTVERDGPNQLISLAEVPKSLEEAFSTRSAQIKEFMQEKGLAKNAKMAALATLATRARKEGHVDRNALRAEWRDVAKDNGISEKQFSEIGLESQTTNPRIKSIPDRETVPQYAYLGPAKTVTTAMSHVSQNATAFTPEKLLSATLKFNQGERLNVLEKTISAKIGEKSLVVVRDPNKEETFLATSEQIRDETLLLAAVKEASTSGGLTDPTGSQISDRRVSQMVRRHTTLSEGQRDALQVSLSGDDRFVAVQGLAGTGKTFMMTKLATDAEKLGYEVEGLAPSNKAVSELKGALGHAETLQARLLRRGSSNRDQDHSKTILLVDEASMVSTKDMLSLVKQANELGVARVVLVGDTKQLDSVAAGSPFRALQNDNIPTALMNDIVRQKNQEALDVVRHSLSGQISAAFEKIGSNVFVSHEHDDNGKSLEGQENKTPILAADLYLQNEQGNAIATTTNKMRHAVNDEVRKVKIAQGVISDVQVPVEGLDPKHMTHAEIADVRSYEKGDIGIVRKSVKESSLTKGETFIVREIDKENNTLLVEKPDGTSALVHPKQSGQFVGAYSIYTETERSFGKGDLVKFRIADKSSEIIAGTKGEITEISRDGISIKTSDDRTIDVAASDLVAKGLDYAYAATLHDLQGETTERLVLAMDVSEGIPSQKAFYVGVSRVKDAVQLVTDNQHKLAKRIELTTGVVLDAVEHEHLQPEPQNEKDLQNTKLEQSNIAPSKEARPQSEVQETPSTIERSGDDLDSNVVDLQKEGPVIDADTPPAPQPSKEDQEKVEPQNVEQKDEERLTRDLSDDEPTNELSDVEEQILNDERVRPDLER